MDRDRNGRGANIIYCFRPVIVRQEAIEGEGENIANIDRYKKEREGKLLPICIYKSFLLLPFLCQVLHISPHA